MLILVPFLIILKCSKDLAWNIMYVGLRGVFQVNFAESSDRSTMNGWMLPI